MEEDLQQMVDTNFMEIIPECISEVQNHSLMDRISLEEVKCALFDLDGEKAPGSDGFLVAFF